MWILWLLYHFLKPKVAEERSTIFFFSVLKSMHFIQSTFFNSVLFYFYFLILPIYLQAYFHQYKSDHCCVYHIYNMNYGQTLL